MRGAARGRYNARAPMDLPRGHGWIRIPRPGGSAAPGAALLLAALWLLLVLPFLVLGFACALLLAALAALARAARALGGGRAHAARRPEDAARAPGPIIDVQATRVE